MKLQMCMICRLVLGKYQSKKMAVHVAPRFDTLVMDRLNSVSKLLLENEGLLSKLSKPSKQNLESQFCTVLLRRPFPVI